MSASCSEVKSTLFAATSLCTAFREATTMDHFDQGLWCWICVHHKGNQFPPCNIQPQLVTFTPSVLHTHCIILQQRLLGEVFHVSQNSLPSKPFFKETWHVMIPKTLFADHWTGTPLLCSLHLLSLWVHVLLGVQNVLTQDARVLALDYFRL